MDKVRKLSIVVLVVYFFIEIFLVIGFASPYWISEKHYGNIWKNKGLWMSCTSHKCVSFRPGDTEKPAMYRISGGLLCGSLACTIIASMCHVVWFFRLKHPQTALCSHATGAALTVLAGILAACSVGVFGYQFYQYDGLLPSGWAYWMVLVCAILLLLHGLLNACSVCYSDLGRAPYVTYSVPTASSVYSLTSRDAMSVKSSKASVKSSLSSVYSGQHSAKSSQHLDNGSQVPMQPLGVTPYRGLDNAGYTYHSGYSDNNRI